MATGNPGPVVPERYAKAIDDADPIESQRKAPKRIKKLIRGLSEKQLAKKPAPGKWSIKEVIGHLADAEVIFGSRVRFVAAMDRAPLPGFDQDAFVEKLGLERVDTAELLEALANVRAANVALMKRLPKESFARVGLHAERGEESIATMVAMHAGHDIIHEQQIERIRAALLVERAGKRAARKALRKKAGADQPADRDAVPVATKPKKVGKKSKAKRVVL